MRIGWKRKSPAAQLNSSLQNDHPVLNRASLASGSDMQTKPKLTIRAHCGENVVTQDERSGSESFGMVSRETSGRERWQRESGQTLHYTKGDCFDGGGICGV